MPTFTYQAKDNTGQTVSGALSAENEREAANQIRNLGYYPMRVVRGASSPEQIFAPSSMYVSMTGAATLNPPVSQTFRHAPQEVKPYGNWFQRSVIFPVYTGVSLRDLAVFFRQVAAMLNAGMNLSRALYTVRQESSSSIRVIATKLNGHVDAGGELSEAMGMFPHVFTDMQRAIVRAAEQSGSLDVMLIRISDYLEADYKLRQMVKRETLSSKINFVATFLIPTLVIAVVQGATAYFNQAVLPLLMILGKLGAGYVVGRYLLSSRSISFNQVNQGYIQPVRPFALVYDTIKAFLPYFGTTVRMLALAKFSRAFSSLYSSGVLIPKAVETCAEVSGNEYLGHMMSKAVPEMLAGASLTEAFGRTGVFPPMFMSMIASGETTGGLDLMLTKVAEFYEAESADRLHKSAQTLSVLFFLAIAAMVGYTVIQFYTQSYGGAINDIIKDIQ